MSTNGTFISMDSLRSRTRAADGPRQWRSLNDLADTPAFQAFRHAEFPEDASISPVSRRDFMKLMGASMALAGATGCTRQPKELIIPYVKQPEDLVPGKSQFFATSLNWQGVGRGVLVESHMGRPTKIEGNPDHPDGSGSSGILMQAAILGMYDPDRSQDLKFRGRTGVWDKFLVELQAAMGSHATDQGESFRLLTGPVTSPTQLSLIQELLTSLPKARWVRYAPLARDAVYAGAQLAFHEAVETVFDLAPADVILSLDSDFLYEAPGSLSYARQFAARRQPSGTGETATLNRLYVAECGASVTGGMADHRLAVSPRTLVALASALARKLGVQVADGAALEAGAEEWIAAVAADLQAHRGRALVVAGDYQPPVVHALVHAINATLDAVGHTVRYTDPLEPNPQDGVAALKVLSDEMAAGKVRTLVVIGANPVYDAPADIPFLANLPFVGLRIHWGLYNDETAEQCHWHIPAAHDLESWGDLRGFDGTVSLQQPLIEALYGGRTAIEILDALMGRPGRPVYELVKAFWQKPLGGVDFENVWKRSIHDGLIAGTAFAARPVSLQWDLGEINRLLAPPAAVPELQVAIRPDPTVWDGSVANNGWLQELPKPLTKVTWENAAHISPRLAERHHLQSGDIIALNAEDRGIQIPVLVQPGQPADTITVHLGYGRTRAGQVGSNIGANAYKLQHSAARWSAPGRLFNTGTRTVLACTQDHHTMDGRELVRQAPVGRFQEHPEFAKSEPLPADANLYPDKPYPGHKWGMVIDLNTCTGCNACTIACQAENNISVVGKEQVAKGREMHWIRVDRYFEGPLDEPEILHQPVPCMHCERAPCETVCPVGATVHSDEGLNDMVYNRCVGTRYCSNNCPYKVRRFNFFAFADQKHETIKLQRNPNVTVRMRGVMEKCSYCVQRINAVRIQSKVEGNRAIVDGEIRTACQQACPAGAIAFGDMNDPASVVTRQKGDPRNYGILEDLNVRPRTTYLARLRNPNPALAKADAGEAAHHG